MLPKSLLNDIIGIATSYYMLSATSIRIPADDANDGSITHAPVQYTLWSAMRSALQLLVAQLMLHASEQHCDFEIVYSNICCKSCKTLLNCQISTVHTTFCDHIWTLPRYSVCLFHMPPIARSCWLCHCVCIAPYVFHWVSEPSCKNYCTALHVTSLAA